MGASLARVIHQGVRGRSARPSGATTYGQELHGAAITLRFGRGIVVEIEARRRRDAKASRRRRNKELGDETRTKPRVPVNRSGQTMDHCEYSQPA